MAVDIYSTLTMLKAISNMPPAVSFLKNRYFPTNASLDIFSTKRVLIDIKEGTEKMAPVVLARKNGITLKRDPFRTESWEPPFVAPKRTLTLDDLNERDFGEAFFPDRTPEDRSRAILGQDLLDLDESIIRREEYMAAMCMKNNGYILTQYSDDYGKTGDEYEIHFYTENENPSKYIPATPWNQGSSNILGDIGIAVKMLTKSNNNATEIIGDASAIEKIVRDPEIQKLLDNRRMEMGGIKPEELDRGVCFYGSIVAGGKNIKLLSYDIDYTDDITNEVKPLFAPGELVVTAEASGKGLYGSVTQIDMGQTEPHTYTGARVPKVYIDVENDTRTLRIASKPLLVPDRVNPWVFMQVYDN